MIPGRSSRPRAVRAQRSLIADELVDELNLTSHPCLVGSDGARSSAPAVDRGFELAHLGEDESYMFGRWVTGAEGPSSPAAGLLSSSSSLWKSEAPSKFL